MHMGVYSLVKTFVETWIKIRKEHIVLSRIQIVIQVLRKSIATQGLVAQEVNFSIIIFSKYRLLNIKDLNF